MFDDCRFYVACEADEDLNYLTEYTGADHLITSSDYGPNDPAEQARLVAQMKAREVVSPALIEKNLCDNPRQGSDQGSGVIIAIPPNVKSGDFQPQATSPLSK